MVRNGLPVPDEQASPQRLAELLASLEGIERIADAAGDVPAYLVGGAVRDLLLGHTGRTDIDVVVEGPVGPIAERLGGEVRAHERFATATVRAGELVADLATARTEVYERPGALPDVRPAKLEQDLARRDFTINAMAIPLSGKPRLIDPHGGRTDLERGTLRVLHDGSFRDDPTRALRAARYAARLEFEPDPATERLLREADLGTVSEDRREAELHRLAAEPRPRRGFELLDAWGLFSLDEQSAELIDVVAELTSQPPWNEVSQRSAVVLAAARGEVGRAPRLASRTPSSPSEGVEMARAASGVELVIARALGAAWLDDYLERWRHVGLEITGEDLLAAGVPQGPALGRGLAAALNRKLDGEIAGREQELAVALEEAREAEQAT
jgi:tRNA nucleotidyltransferase (CCA-adding enzyme)